MKQLEFPFAPEGLYRWYYTDGNSRLFTHEEITYDKNGKWKPKDQQND